MVSWKTFIFDLIDWYLFDLKEPDYGTAERKAIAANKAAVTNGLEASPKPGRKQLASSEECLPKVNGETLGDLEALKQDLLREVRREINKAKLEIIEGKYRVFIYVYPI